MTAPSLLIIDDEQDILFSLQLLLRKRFKLIRTARHPAEAKKWLADEKIDLVLLDLNYQRGYTSGKEGITYLEKIKKWSPSTSVVLMTAFADVDVAVEGMKRGACDFVVKPFSEEEVLQKIDQCLQPEQVHSPKRNPQPRGSWTLGSSPQALDLQKLVEKVAQTRANVLITGENGTGKSQLAQYLHERSDRKDQSLITLDLGALPESLMESELLGYVKGAFTDARNDKKGKIEEADSGTLFLDELANMTLPVQAKLLTVLQERKICRLGSNEWKSVDFRLIAATNASLPELIKSGQFRQDLLYRINTIELVIPPLRERAEDIEIFADQYLKHFNREYQKELSLTKDAKEELRAYSWPGNLRELAHKIERAVILGEGNELSATDFDLPTQEGAPKQLFTRLDDVEKQAITQAIKMHGGNLTQAALALGMGRTTLYRKIEKYGIEVL